MTEQDIVQKLTANGHRPTASRLEVVKMLQRVGGHVTADTLYEKMRDGGSSVGRMTVFRTLDLLAEIGIIRPIYQGSGAAHFVLLEGGHHHHLVCTQCDKTIEFEDCSLADGLSQQLANEHGFQISGHLMEIYGVCAECQ